MSASRSVKALLVQSEKKQSDIMELLEMSSRQSLTNKFTNNRWSANDLARIAKFCDCKLAFLLPDGQEIIITEE